MSFCHAPSERAFARVLAVVVQLNQQHHVTTATLRAMHEPAHSELRALGAELDTYGFISSRTLELARRLRRCGARTSVRAPVVREHTRWDRFNRRRGSYV